MSLDAVRVVGIAGIVANHVWAEGLPGRLTYAWDVPVFFFLSGWLWKPGRPMREEISNRTRSLLVPYAAWLILLAVIVIARALKAGRSIEPTVPEMIYGGKFLTLPFVAFWFVTALFATCLIRRALDQAPLSARVAIALAALLVSYPAHQLLANTPGSIGMSLAGLFFLVMGELCARIRHLLRFPGLLGSVLVGVSVLVLATTGVGVVDLKSGRLGTPGASVLIGVGISLGLVLVASSAEPLIRRFTLPITAVGRVGIFIILAHGLVLYLLGGAGRERWSDFLLAFGIPAVVGMVVYHTLLARVFVAWPQASRSPVSAGLMASMFPSSKKARRARPGTP